MRAFSSRLWPVFVAVVLAMAIGASPAAAAAAPGAPTNVTAVAGNESATVSWDPPSSTGDSALVSYSVTSHPGNIQAHVNPTLHSATVSGLTNGTAYTFTVHATNGTGNGPESSPSAAVTPSASATSAPGAPTGVTADPDSGAADVRWTAPASDGGSAITSYVVTSAPGGKTATTGAAARSATVSGLSNGTAHTFTVRAVNAKGTGPASGASSSITVGAPDAPTHVRVAAGDRSVTVTWSEPDDNGSHITSSIVTVSPGGRTATVSGDDTSATVTGLTNETAYTATVRSTNARGTSPTSAPSDSVRPVEVDEARRLAGRDRILTAIELSEDTWDSGAASTVVLARSDQFADALAGAPLAVAEDGPLLLTPSDELDDDVWDEIDRVLDDGDTIYLLGGTAALSRDIQETLEDDDYEVVRLAGDNRFETATEIADEGLGNPTRQLLVTGLDFADGLAAGAVAAHIGGAVLLTDGDRLEDETRDYLDDHPGTRYAVGGQAADAVRSAEDLAGRDRYETAAIVAERFFDDPTDVGLASGAAFADALAGSVHIAHHDGPLLLVGTSLPSTVESYLEDERSSLTTIHVYGGDAAVRDSVVDDALDAID